MKRLPLFPMAVVVLLLGQSVTFSQSTPREHRVAVRSVNGRGQFYFRDSGASFVPRGNNFIRLAQQTELPGFGGSVVKHSMFNVSVYDASDMEKNLALMSSSGYNMVRIFLNDCCSGGIGNTQGPGLSQRYLANVTDFLDRARAHGIFVQIVGFSIPDAGGYGSQVPNPLFGFPHVLYMTAGGINAVAKFWKDFISGLATQNAPFDAILGFDIWNELSFDLSALPLSMTSGTVTTANGMSYDLSSPSSRQALIDDNLINFLNQVRASILAVDPSALVSVSFGPPNGPNPTPFEDPVHQIFRSYPAICCSNLDFVDLHPYLWGLSLAQLVQNFQLTGVTVKPIVMFEYGALLNGGLYPISSAAAAATLLQQWQTSSCSFGFSGWGLWSWDLDLNKINNDAANYWTATSADGVVDNALGPKSRPDPCKPGMFLNQDLALGGTATASNSLATNGPQFAADGVSNTQWSSGAFSPQWIEIGLPGPSTVGGVRLTVAQFPSGQTVHELYIRRAGGALELVNEFRGLTQNGQVLTWLPAQQLTGVTGIRVTTTASPSYVAWREIEVLSGDAGQPSIKSVLNGASYDPAITPGSWVVIQGTGFSSSERTWQTSDFSGSQLPTKIDGVSVSIDGAPAPIYYVSPTQLNVQAPATIRTGQAVPVTVSRDNVQVTGSAQSASKTYDPALFAYTASGALYVAAVFSDGIVVGDPSKTAGTRGARPGDRLSLYGTGFGGSPSGLVVSSPIALLNPISVSVGGKDAIVEYAGLVGVGLVQLNIVIPDLPVGDFPVVVQIQGIGAASSPSIPIR